MIFRSFVTRDSAILRRAYVTYVRPLVEYCTPVWYPVSAHDIRLIENVQRKYTKRIPALKNCSYEERLQKLSLETLELRRLRFDLHMVYKIVNKLVDLPLDQFFAWATYLDTRGASVKLFKPRCITSARSNYFSVRIINCWNSLSDDVLMASSLASFKYKLSKVDLTRFLSGYV